MTLVEIGSKLQIGIGVWQQYQLAAEPFSNTDQKFHVISNWGGNNMAAKSRQQPLARRKSRTGTTDQLGSQFFRHQLGRQTAKSRPRTD
jgi:hypothetical protein